MKLYDIDLTSNDLEQGNRLKKVSVPCDAKNLKAYSSKGDSGSYHGVSYISNGVNKTKSINLHFVELGDEVQECWVFLGVLSIYSIHVYYSE